MCQFQHDSNNFNWKQYDYTKATDTQRHISETGSCDLVAAFVYVNVPNLKNCSAIWNVLWLKINVNAI